MKKNDLLLLINETMSEENKMVNNEDTKGTALLDRLESTLEDLFGEDIAFDILCDVVCNIRIDKKKRLQIMDSILSIKGLE